MHRLISNEKFQQYEGDLVSIEESHDGLWRVGENGVENILTPMDRKVEFLCFPDKILGLVKSAMGYPALYPLPPVAYEAPARAILMDLDGTSVRSEEFWVWVIEQVTRRLLGDDKFQLEPEDVPHVSGHSVSEHLQYCIDKYCPDKSVEEARKQYFAITRHELAEIMAGRGKTDAFKPSPGLKVFLQEVKAAGVQVGLVTSGLHEKAWPGILSAFRVMEMGDPRDFYDAMITAGFALEPGQPGTLGELSPKPHPWLYAETARVGLGIGPEDRHRVVGFEDSSAGVVSIRLAGFAAVGVRDGNIEASGVRPLLHDFVDDLTEALPLVLGD